MSKPELHQTTAEYTRKEVNKAAQRHADNLRQFMKDADQFLSTLTRYDLTRAASHLEELANGR